MSHYSIYICGRPVFKFSLKFLKRLITLQAWPFGHPGSNFTVHAVRHVWRMSTMQLEQTGEEQIRADKARHMLFYCQNKQMSVRTQEQRVFWLSDAPVLESNKWLKWLLAITQGWAKMMLFGERSNIMVWSAFFFFFFLGDSLRDLCNQYESALSFCGRQPGITHVNELMHPYLREKINFTHSHICNYSQTHIHTFTVYFEKTECEFLCFLHLFSCFISQPSVHKSLASVQKQELFLL